MRWMTMPYARYADFSGRSCRMEYWMFHLLWLLALMVGLVLIFVGMDLRGNAEPKGLGPVGWLGVAAMVMFILGSVIPSIAVTVRRFHDQNLSGWMYLISFIPSIGGIIVFVFMCIEGTHGPNRFGDDPKGPESTADVFN